MDAVKTNLALAKKAASDFGSNVKSQATKVVNQNLEAMTPEQRKAWSKRHEQVSALHAKASEQATNLTNKVKEHIATATEKVKDFRKNVTTNGISTAALTASHDAAQVALQKIQQICGKYQKTPRPGSVAESVGGRRRRTLRKRR